MHPDGTHCRETLDNYLRTANSVIDECLEITGRGTSPSSATFSIGDYDEDRRRQVDSGISFGSINSSNRSSVHSHTTRPSTSSSVSAHSRKTSREKHLPEKPLPTTDARRGDRQGQTHWVGAREDSTGIAQNPKSKPRPRRVEVAPYDGNRGRSRTASTAAANTHQGPYIATQEESEKDEIGWGAEGDRQQLAAHESR